MTPEERANLPPEILAAMDRADARLPGEPIEPIPLPNGSVYIGTMYPMESTSLEFHREVDPNESPIEPGVYGLRRVDDEPRGFWNWFKRKFMR